MTDIDCLALDRELKKGTAEVQQRRTWDEFVEACRLTTGGEHA
jgi:hypothetical protein